MFSAYLDSATNQTVNLEWVALDRSLSLLFSAPMLTERHLRAYRCSLDSFQVAVLSGARYLGEEARMTNADWARPGNLTFTIQ